MLQVFKAGKHRTASGEVLEFSETDIQAIASGYDRRRYEAPFLVGHDESQPNKGLVKAAFAQGESLWVQPHRVDAEFAESVNAGRWPSVSVRLYRPGEAGNPTPEQWALRHVAVVQIPAVKGLDAPAFSETDGVVIDFQPIEFSEAMPVTTTNASETNADLSAREAELNRREAELNRKEITQFVEGVIKEGRIVPAQKAGVVAFMESLSVEPVQFAEGADKQSARAWFEGFLKKLPKQVEFKEVAGGDLPTNRSPEELARAATAYQAEQAARGIVVSAAQAVRHVQKG
jgi:hypothetical protein